MKRLDCKIIKTKIEDELREKTELFVSKGNRAPSLAVILVGNNAASQTYVRNKKDAAERLGYMHFDYSFSEDAKEGEILRLIDELNERDDVDGILVQLPLPNHIDENKIIDRISKEKDVDGFSPYNAGLLMLSRESYVPCTPKGIIEILKYYEIETSGKNVVVIGRSNIVGKPMATLLMQKGVDATVTVCNTKTKDLSFYTKNADIIIVATGRVNTLNSSMCKNDAVIIDVGINRIKDESKKSGFRLVGDVDYSSFENTECQVTPVPGGVGVMTVTMLMENTYISALRRAK